MTRGKRTCKILKEIRQQIADNNDIEYITSECHFHGECKGTCPKCESEVRYLENELNKRRQLGKVVAITGISLGVAGTFSACNAPKQENVLPEAEMQNEITQQDTFDLYLPSPPPSYIKSVGYIPLIISYDGEIIDEDNILTGKLIINPEDSIIDNGKERIYELTEKLAMFPGGEEKLYQFLNMNIQYPEEASEKNIEGLVSVRFVIEKDGTITNPQIIFDIGSGCGKEVMRVIGLMPKWVPAEHNGQIVRSYSTIPVRFDLAK